MAWLQLHFTSNKNDVDKLEHTLLQLGAVAITLRDANDEPQFEPAPGETPLWSQITLSALFESDAQTPLFIEQLNAQLDTPLPSANIEFLDDVDWERAWMKHFTPIKLGHTLWICPSWLEPPEPDAINLRLDPGLAFGSGSHQTTRLCLEWLDQHAHENKLQHKHIIDYGCGSGILAIAALLLGASRAYAIDYDPQALIASRDNAQKNAIDKRQLQLFLPEQFTQGSASIVLANILAGPLLQLAPHFCSLVEKRGHLILSGILDTQREMIIDAYQKDFAIVNIAQRDDWLRIDCIKH